LVFSTVPHICPTLADVGFSRFTLREAATISEFPAANARFFQFDESRKVSTLFISL
jgi:hypothetical protein